MPMIILSIRVETEIIFTKKHHMFEKSYIKDILYNLQFFFQFEAKTHHSWQSLKLVLTILVFSTRGNQHFRHFILYRPKA